MKLEQMTGEMLPQFPENFSSRYIQSQKWAEDVSFPTEDRAKT